jgi:alkylation response protein AidB-like acyl-CoA dehydrogenase
VVNGSKIWTSFAQLAGRIYLLAKTSPDAPRHHNLTILLMNLRQPGVTVRPLRQITGRPEFNQLFFDDCVAWPDEVLGEVNDGWRLATIGAGGLRAAAAGASTWHHYVEMVGWVDRIEEGGRLQGTVNPRVAEFRDQLSLLWWHVARCSDMVAGSSGFLPPAGAAQVIKLHWSELAQRIVAEGLRASPPEHREFWRDAYLEARPTTIYGGSSQLRRNVLADHVLKLRKR